MPWISINEACKEINVARRTIYHWIKNNKIIVKRTAGGSIRIDRDSLFRDYDEIVSKNQTRHAPTQSSRNITI